MSWEVKYRVYLRARSDKNPGRLDMQLLSWPTLIYTFVSINE